MTAPETTTPVMLKIIEAAANYKDGELLWKILADEDERRWRISSKKITQDEWLEMIEKIPDRIVKIQVACIVWWDFVESWPKFDRYLAAWKITEVPVKKDVLNTLMDLGYPERIAIERVKVIKP